MMIIYKKVKLTLLRRWECGHWLCICLSRRLCLCPLFVVLSKSLDDDMLKDEIKTVKAVGVWPLSLYLSLSASLSLSLLVVLSKSLKDDDDDM